MRCPVCAVDLKMADREGIEIDYCPQCRGVWLDRGELDKLIERATPNTQGMAYQGQPANQNYQQPPMYNNNQYYDDDDDDDRKHSYNSYNQPYPQHGQYPRKKREGFLGNLFDFD